MIGYKLGYVNVTLPAFYKQIDCLFDVLDKLECSNSDSIVNTILTNTACNHRLTPKDCYTLVTSPDLYDYLVSQSIKVDVFAWCLATYITQTYHFECSFDVYEVEIELDAQDVYNTIIRNLAKLLEVFYD